VNSPTLTATTALVDDLHHTDLTTYPSRITIEDSMHRRRVRRAPSIHNNKLMEDHPTGKVVEEEAGVEVAEVVLEDMVVSKMEEDMTAQMLHRGEEDFGILTQLLAVTTRVASTKQMPCL